MSFEEDLETLKNEVKVAEDEVMTAIVFHESWRPTVQDPELLKRMGNSYATHTFQIISWALRRETLLSMWKLWDTSHKAVRFSSITDRISQGDFFERLVTYRAERTGLTSSGTRPAMKKALEEKFDKVIALVRKYQGNGTGVEIRTKLTALRNEVLAHRQKNALVTSSPQFTDDEMEEFYQDNLEVMRLLNSLISGTHFDMKESAGVYQTYASYFWAGVCGERTKGHPKYIKA